MQLTNMLCQRTLCKCPHHSLPSNATSLHCSFITVPQCNTKLSNAAGVVSDTVFINLLSRKMKNQQRYEQRKPCFCLHTGLRCWSSVMLEATNYNRARVNSPRWTPAVHLPTVISSNSPSWQPLKWSVSFFNHAVLVHVCQSLKALGRPHNVEPPGTTLRLLSWKWALFQKERRSCFLKSCCATLCCDMLHHGDCL